MNDARDGQRLPQPSPAASYAVARQRFDTWQQLKSLAGRWAAGVDATRAPLLKSLETLHFLEAFWAYPGRHTIDRLRALADDDAREALARLASFVVRMLVSHAYRLFVDQDAVSDPIDEPPLVHPALAYDERPYFEVLVVDDLPRREAERLEARLAAYRTDADEFVYGLVIVPSYEDAIGAVLVNHHIQSVVVRYGFPLESRHPIPGLMEGPPWPGRDTLDEVEVGLNLGHALRALRPELDLFLVTDAPIEELAGHTGGIFRRVFYRQEDHRELHHSILKGITERYHTPFFSALLAYTRRPTGVFHALPIARGKSVERSHWIREAEELFGNSMFLAETSTTSGGLDSLLQPFGSLREAQRLAARAYGARRSYFVTNGTSTANKIVLQALCSPGDIVLLARDCHQSHHYALMLSGAQPVYLDPYPLHALGLTGGVTLETILGALARLRDAGDLHRVKALLLTSCTFDGIVYDPARLMEAVLAVHPAMAFIWDEAWFAFAGFTPITRPRTAMAAADAVRARVTVPVRVYATQSTHKTLTSLRQGSMIHVSDDLFDQVDHAFQQAYLTHTSTSASYPILASLDIGRRQVELEGYELVQHAIDLAITLRTRVNFHSQLSQRLRFLTPQDLVPEEYRPSGFTGYGAQDWPTLDRAWMKDPFCLDPTRLTLWLGSTGMRGDAFKRRLLEEHDIQVNKTTTHTALFMTHIGTTRGAVAHLIEALHRVCQLLPRDREQESSPPPPLPGFTGFHPRFQGTIPELGDLREAFYLGTRPSSVRHLTLPRCADELAGGRSLVSATFVTPYPPGFPVLVPGQVLTPELLEFLRSVEVREIHGYDRQRGLVVFDDAALEAR